MKKQASSEENLRKSIAWGRPLYKKVEAFHQMRPKNLLLFIACVSCLLIVIS